MWYKVTCEEGNSKETLDDEVLIYKIILEIVSKRVTVYGEPHMVFNRSHMT